MKHASLFLITLSLGFGSFCSADQEITSANGGERLLEFYQRFPDADLNGDHILTVDEMHDYLKAKIKDGSTSKGGEKEAKSLSAKESFGKLKSRVILAKFLEKSPEADNNPKDNILTKQELLDYVLSQKKFLNDKGEKVPVLEVIAAPDNDKGVASQAAN